MSSLTFLGFFCLASAHRVVTQKANNARAWHMHYSTTIQCADGTSLPADLRVYSPMNDIPHPDNTIAFVYARGHIPHNDIAVLDASHVIPFPGDPDDETYEDSVPNLPNPFVIGLGQVTGRTELLSQGSRLFHVATSDFVRDNIQLSNIG